MVYPGLTATASIVLQLYRASDNSLVETMTFAGLSVSNGGAPLTVTFATQLAVDSSYLVVAVASGNLTKFVSAGQTYQGSWALPPRACVRDHHRHHGEPTGQVESPQAGGGQLCRRPSSGHR